MSVLLALAVGFCVALLITRLGLPVPAPGTAAGVAGVIGLFLGSLVGGRS